MKLSDKKCIPCERGDIEPLSCIQSEKLFLEHQADLQGWKLNEVCVRISYEKLFSDFITAMKFINKVAIIAEEAGHHPDIYVWYNKVQLDLWTHSIGGLSENDFIVAAKINQILL